MRAWLFRFSQISLVLMLLAVAGQGSAVCAAGDLAISTATAAGAMTHDGGAAPSEHKPMTGHPAGRDICKQVCLSCAIVPLARQEWVGVPRMAALPLTDEIYMPSLRPDVVDRPPKATA